MLVGDVPRRTPRPGCVYVGRMSHQLKCGDVVPGCAATFESDSEDELLKQVADHAAADHGMTDIDDATLAQVKSKITTT